MAVVTAASRRKTEHLVLAEQRQKRRTGECHLWCKGCDDYFTFVLPCSLLMAPAVMKQFEREHAECRERVDAARAGLLRVLKERAWCMRLARALLEAQGLAR